MTIGAYARDVIALRVSSLVEAPVVCRTPGMTTTSWSSSIVCSKRSHSTALQVSSSFTYLVCDALDPASPDAERLGHVLKNK
jgi:hypothetical protein